MSKFRAPSAPDTRPGASQSGLSLVELLIATALGLILTLGVIQIYLSGNETYRQTQGLAHAQESTRFVSAVLTPDFRSAGSFGCLAEMGRPLDQVVDNRLNGGLVVPLDQALQDGSIREPAQAIASRWQTPWQRPAPVIGLRVPQVQTCLLTLPAQ